MRRGRRGRRAAGKKLVGLASDWAAHTAEVVADFRQFYGIDLPLVPTPCDGVERLALLWSQLPRDSRVARLHSPDLTWGEGEWLAWAVEAGVRRLCWMLSEDGRRGRNAPRPLPTPGERARNEARRDAALSARADIDRALGLTTE